MHTPRMTSASDQRKSAAFVWTDRALFIGDRSETAMHSHHAVEVCVALDDRGIEMRSGDIQLRKAATVVVRSDAMHALSIPGPKVAVFYVDPDAPVGKGLEEWLGERDIAELDPKLAAPHQRAMRALFARSQALEDADAACDAMLGAITPEHPRVYLDKRVRRAMAYLDDRLDDPPRLDEVAEHIGISGNRLRSLFSEQVGVPMRRYVLWRKLRKALIAAVSGESMTDAAHIAGFSDAAHFTRTCARMFGLPPTAFSPVDDVFVAPE